MLHCQQPAEGTSKYWLILLFSTVLLRGSDKIKAQAGGFGTTTPVCGTRGE